MQNESCFVPGCESNLRVGLPRVPFHPIPKENSLQWLETIGQDPLTLNIDSKKICSRHFAKEDFVIGTKTLKPNVLPSLDLHLNSIPTAGADFEWYPDLIIKEELMDIEELGIQKCDKPSLRTIPYSITKRESYYVPPLTRPKLKPEPKPNFVNCPPRRSRQCQPKTWSFGIFHNYSCSPDQQSPGWFQAEIARVKQETVLCQRRLDCVRLVKNSNKQRIAAMKGFLHKLQNHKRPNTNS